MLNPGSATASILIITMLRRVVKKKVHEILLHEILASLRRQYMLNPGSATASILIITMLRRVVKKKVHEILHLTQNISLTEHRRCDNPRSTRSTHIRWQNIWCSLRWQLLIGLYSCNVMFSSLQLHQDVLSSPWSSFHHAVLSKLWYLTLWLYFLDVVAFYGIIIQQISIAKIVGKTFKNPFCKGRNGY